MDDVLVFPLVSPLPPLPLSPRMLTELCGTRTAIYSFLEDLTMSKMQSRVTRHAPIAPEAEVAGF